MDLGVETYNPFEVIEKITQKVIEDNENFIVQTITPYCEEIAQCKISKKELEEAIILYEKLKDKTVLLADIQMPQDCPMCPMSYWNKLDQFTGCSAVNGKKFAMNDAEYAKTSTRPDWCPLKEIENGRLKD